MKSGRYGIFILVLLAFVAITLAVVGPWILNKPTVVSPAASRTDAGGAVTAKGVVESEQEIEVSSQLDGLVRRVTVKEGDQVTKGQVLVVFDEEKIAAQVLQAEAVLAGANAKLKELETGYRSEDTLASKSILDRSIAIFNQSRDDFERHKRLYAKEAVTLVELKKSEERLRIAEADVAEKRSIVQKFDKGARSEEIEQAKGAKQQAVAQLSHVRALQRDYQILSPLDGLVVESFLDSGESAKVGTPVLKLIDPKSLRIRAELDETDIGKVREGQNVEATADPYPGKVFKGKVYKTFSVVKKKTQKTFDPMASFDINIQKIHIKLEDFSGLNNGMTVTVRFGK